MTMPCNKELDARGLNCPLPILRLKKTLAEMAGNEVLRTRTTDAGSVKDFQAFCRQTGNDLLDFSEHDGEYVFLIRKKG